MNTDLSLSSSPAERSLSGNHLNENELAMKKHTILTISLILVLMTGQAYGAYVSDNLKITVRTGTATDHKIIAMIQVGQNVEVLRTSNGWSQIRLPEEKVGWVLSRFLTSEEPSRQVLERLKKSYEKLKNETSPLLAENKSFKKENETLISQLAEQTKRAESLYNELDGLKQDRIYRWFLLGAGVLLLGFLLGFISRHQRKRTFLS
ncbi:MAG: TIGR04211 family SH3 domain-containing protein [Candidatus Adiutricales bacterium]